jgi:hypothetical protein
VTDPANPGQPYGGQPGQPYGGQPGQPYGGQPGQPYGGQPGQPGQPGESYGGGQQAFGGQPPSPYSGYSGEAPAPNPYGAPVPPPVKKSKAGKIIGIIVGVLVLLIAVCVGGGALLLKNAKSDPANAKVGNCLAGDTMDSTNAKPVNNVKVVDCTATDAKYKVVGVVDGKTETDFKTDDAICKAYTTAESALWQGSPGKSGSVLCLEPVKK